MNTHATLRPELQWLFSRRVDLLFTLAGAVVVSVVLALLVEQGIAFLFLSTAFAVVLDFPHVLQTYVRLLLDPAEYRTYRSEFNWSCLVIAGASAYLWYMGEMLLVVTVWVYWQPFHVYKQHLGIMSIYARKNGYTGPLSLSRTVLLLGCLAPLVHRLANQGLAFGEHKVFGMTLPFSGMHIPTPPVSNTVAWLLYALFLGAAVLFAVEEVQQARHGKALPPVVLATMGIVVVSYNLSYLLVRDLYAVILIATTIHSLQYHALCWRPNRKRFQENGDMHRLVPMLNSVPAASSGLIFGGGLLAAGALCASLTLVGQGLIPLVIILHHFYLDGIIWKKGRNSDLQTGGALAPRPV